MVAYSNNRLSNQAIVALGFKMKQTAEWKEIGPNPPLYLPLKVLTTEYLYSLNDSLLLTEREQLIYCQFGDIISRGWSVLSICVITFAAEFDLFWDLISKDMIKYIISKEGMGMLLEQGRVIVTNQLEKDFIK